MQAPPSASPTAIPFARLSDVAILTTDSRRAGAPRTVGAAALSCAPGESAGYDLVVERRGGGAPRVAGAVTYDAPPVRRGGGPQAR